MTRLYLLLLLQLSATALLSQQCGYDKYYLFVLDVHAKNSATKMPDLKMYLVDEQDKPILAGVTYQEDKQWKHRNDTLFFWDNLKAKKGAATRPLFRQQYFNLGDYYVVAFRLDNSVLKDPQNYPIYKVKIEADFMDWPYETKIVHLPLQKAVRICNNGITEDFTLVKPVETFDGKNFEPISIILEQGHQAMAEAAPKEELKYTVRFDYQTITGPGEGMDTYLLNNARIYNTETGKLHQEIYIPRITKSASKESKNIVQFIDFYNRGIKEAQDFSVQIESWRDLEIKGYRQKLNYYIFNYNTKKYELDTLLSNYNDVFYHQPLKTMRRYDYEVTKKSRIAYTYQLENKTWVLIDKNETLFEPPPPKIKYPASSCIVMNGEKTHMLTLQAVIGTNAKRLVKDTFWLYNLCDDTLTITKVQSSTRDFFSINQTLLPKQRIPLIFNGTLISNSFDFHIQHFNCSLTLTDGSILAVTIMVPMVSNNATVYYRPDSTVEYAIGNRPKARFATAVFTFPNGQVRTKGTVQDKDTSQKVGNWLHFKEGTNRSDEVTYSKAISLSAFDDYEGYKHTRFKVKVLENGVWKEPVMDDDSNELNFYLTPQTDSIIAYTDTTSYGFVLPYKKLPVYIKKDFYLLKPNERTIKVGYYEMPFKVYKNQYAIVLNYSILKSRNKTTYQLIDSFITDLQKQYPKIATVWVSKNQRGISLQGLEHEERGKVLQQLVRDSSIAFISQLFSVGRKERIAYCDNRVYAEIDIEDEQEFKRRALRLNFYKIDMDMGGNRYWLTFPGKLIDEPFFEAFHRLTKEKKVMAVYFNSYYEQELDNRFKN
jgi:hypothetical protein